MLKILGWGSIGPLVVLGAAGCLSGEDPSKNAGSIRGADEVSAAPGLSAPTCDTAKLFNPPVVVPGFDERDIYSARLSADELTAVLSVVNGATGVDFFTASRATTADPFVIGVELAELNTAGDEYWPTLSADRLTIYFESARPTPLDDGGPGTPRIWEATRPAVDAPFGAPIVPTAFRVNGLEAAPYLSPSGRTLYFSSSAFGGPGQLDLEVADINGYGVVTGFAPVPGSSPVEENMPVITGDERTLYFARGGDPSTRDIWVVGRTDDFPAYGVLSGQVTPLAQDIAQEVIELNSVHDEFPSWLSSDGCRLYFISNRPVGGVSRYRVWVAQK
jgi:hypothetical protein